MTLLAFDVPKKLKCPLKCRKSALLSGFSVFMPLNYEQKSPSEYLRFRNAEVAKGKFCVAKPQGSALLLCKSQTFGLSAPSCAVRIRRRARFTAPFFVIYPSQSFNTNIILCELKCHIMSYIIQLYYYAKLTLICCNGRTENHYEGFCKIRQVI